MSDDEDEFLSAESGDEGGTEQKVTRKKSERSSPRPSPTVPPSEAPDLSLDSNVENTLIEPTISRTTSPKPDQSVDASTIRKRGASFSPVSTAESGNNVTATGLSEMADTLIRHLAERDQDTDVAKHAPPAPSQHDLMNGDDTSEEEAEEGEWGGTIPENEPIVSEVKKGFGKGEVLPDDFDHDRVFKMTNSETGEVYDLRTGLPWGSVPVSEDGGNEMFSLRGLIPTRELLVATAGRDESDISEDGNYDRGSISSASSKSPSTDKKKSMFARGIHKVNKRMKEKMKSTEGDPFQEAAKKGVAYVAPGHEEIGDHVKVNVHSKTWSEWSSLFLVQGISAHEGPIWCLAWSPSGMFLASAGQDGCINVWKVIENKEDLPQKWREDGPKTSARNSTRSWNCPVVREDGMPTPLGEGGGETLPKPPPEESFPQASPWRRWKEHTMDIVDLSWNQNDFLLSASIDRTVRLWHVSSTECLHVFPHADFVTSVDFHPKNDLLFLSGCFDKRLRVWSIPESHVAAWATTPEMITSVCFSPSGNQALAGLFNGQVFFWHTDSQGLDAAPEVDSPNTPNSTSSDAKSDGTGGTAVAAVAAKLMAESHVRLRYYTQVEARNRRGKFQQGRKVTGLCWLPSQALRTKEQHGKFAPPQTEASEGDLQKMPAKVIASTKSISGQMLPQQLLVTTNDSRVRLFQMETFSQLCKFKGLSNENMQIRSSFSWDGKYVVSGSENGHVHIWNTTNDYATAQEMSGEHLQAVGGNRWLQMAGNRQDRNQAQESFRATRATKSTDDEGNETSMPAIATAAVFAPFSTVSLAAAASDKHMLYTDLEQLANSIIVVADYSGKLRFFMRASADDMVDHEGDMF